jgi:hypothetical protein
MKKILTICLLLVISFSINAQTGAPTKEQTFEWLNIKLPSLYKYDVNFSKSSSGWGIGSLKITLNEIIATGHDSNGKVSSELIHWDEIKDIYYKNNEVRIIANEHLYIGLEFFQINEELGNKYVKALKNMATLSGATLVKDDLFGN